MDVPIHDNHFHCRADGHRGLVAAQEFEAAGGSSIAHVKLPTYPTTVAQFRKDCLTHLAFSDEIRKHTNLTVYTAIGPYPLEPMKIAEAKGWGAGMDFGRGCFDVAKELLQEGLAHCLGEVGRAHFEVPAELQAHNNELLQYGFHAAKDAGVPIMLHTEHTTPDTMAEFGTMADVAGLARDRVIKHYCGPLVESEEHHGLFPSIIAGRSNIRKALAKNHDGRFMLETDYIDEPTRPDVVMPHTTVPKRVLGLMENGELSSQVATAIGETWPQKLYGM